MVGNGEKWWESEDAMKLERGMSDEQIKAATHDLRWNGAKRLEKVGSSFVVCAHCTDLKIQS
jgi:hypothetical protein